MRIVPQSVSLEYITPDPAKVIERAGRTCYRSEDKITNESAAAFVKMILKMGHESVIEHAVASFRIICDRGISHEIVRHRLASLSQESSRYCSYDKDKFGHQITVIQPYGVAPCQDYKNCIRPSCHACWSYIAWFDACENAESKYFSMLAHGQAPQIARSVLPTCLKTELVMTANFREWRHFLKLRTSEKAHPQMREVAMMIKGMLVVACPEVFGEET